MPTPAMQPQYFPEKRMFRFAWILPLSGLMLTGVLVWPMHQWIAAYLGVPLSTPFAQHRNFGFLLRFLPLKTLFELVAALNLPGRILEIPYEIFFSPNQRKSPQPEIELYIWNTVLWPWLCIPFWWMAGRAMDALIAVKHQRIIPKINWLETILGAAMAVLYTVLFFGVLFAMTNHRDTRLINYAPGSGLWAMLGGLSVVARIRQRRLLKKQQTSVQPKIARSSLAAASLPS